MSDSNKRKAKAHERQAAIVAKMKAHQSKLTENVNAAALSGLDDSNDAEESISGVCDLIFFNFLHMVGEEGCTSSGQTAMNHDYSNPFINSSEQQQERLREASLSCGDKQIQSYILYDVTNFGREDCRGQCTNEITIRKRYASAVTTGSGTSSLKNTCNNGNWRRMLVNKLDKENSNKG
nr:E3 ubiquitin-protein ligase PRT6-like isoform X1 [Tanacetum cinerariifolium]